MLRDNNPSLVPESVDESQLAVAKALETLRYTFSDVVRTSAAGFVIPFISIPYCNHTDLDREAQLALLILVQMIHPWRLFHWPDRSPHIFQHIE